MDDLILHYYLNDETLLAVRDLSILKGLFAPFSFALSDIIIIIFIGIVCFVMFLLIFVFIKLFCFCFRLITFGMQ